MKRRQYKYGPPMDGLSEFGAWMTVAALAFGLIRFVMFLYTGR